MDRENLNKALELNKDILTHIDRSIHDRNQELRLLDIYHKMDARSTAVYDKVKKFKVNLDVPPLPQPRHLNYVIHGLILNVVSESGSPR